MVHLLERDVLRAAGRTDTDAGVLARLRGEDELPDAVADHLGLDGHVLELLAVVDADDLAHEARQDAEVAVVRAHGLPGPGGLDVLQELALRRLDAAQVAAAHP